MIVKRVFFFSLVVAVVGVMSFLPSEDAMAQRVSGAIFTTDINSRFVNNNLYDTKADVYLNGGPRPNAPCDAAGLPYGTYYFQVTDPSGKVLLSSDPIADRQFRVEHGLIVENLATHGTGIGKCVGIEPLNITIQLAPFFNTPNPGGEYKVWITKTSDCDPNSPAGACVFVPSKSKTDNFKVETVTCVGDFDCDGIADTLDSDIDGDGIPNEFDNDNDNDGVVNNMDLCPGIDDNSPDCDRLS